MSVRNILAVALWLFTWVILQVQGSWTALWPSVVAISTVFILRRAILGLLSGATAGMVLLENGNPAAVFVSFFQDHLLPSLQSSWNLSILIFTLMLGGFVAVIGKGGGIEALLHRWVHRDKRGRRTMLGGAYGLGLLCFFDGLANSMLVGRTMQEPTRRMGISGEKLAYVVDSTSSAVACVAVMSTWIAYQLSMIREGFAVAGIASPSNPFQLFLQSIPFNFYCWFTLILLAVVIIRDWNIGPMHRAEMDARRSLDSSPVCPNETKVASALPSQGYRAVLPLVVLTGGLLVGLYWDGTSGALFPLNLARISEAFGGADAALVMLGASTLASGVAIAFNARPIRNQGSGVSEVFMEGVQRLFQPICILISAWIFSSTVKQLDAVSVLGALMGGGFPLWIFPLVVFFIGAVISFSSGTSWGTMGVLMPLALPVAIQLSASPDSFTVIGTIAAVFSGAVFGDHCSPLSDTTIVSSISCGVEPFAHVRTQLPYAGIAAGTAILVGFLPAGLGLPAYASLLIGTALIVSLPFLFRSPTPNPHA